MIYSDNYSDNLNQKSIYARQMFTSIKIKIKQDGVFLFGQKPVWSQNVHSVKILVNL